MATTNEEHYASLETLLVKVNEVAGGLEREIASYEKFISAEYGLDGVTDSYFDERDALNQAVFQLKSASDNISHVLYDGR